MHLTKVTIDNFRNIKHAEYEMNDLNVFTGPNRKGKTNTILAIYWALTDYLLDASSDYASFKPLEDKQAEVAVELEFSDGFKLRKTYAENWVKTRGSSEKTMTGNVTKYFIDDISVSVTEAKKEIRKRMGIEGKSNVSKFDLLRCVVDPYYLAKEQWKVTREFIIELVGDVSNEDVVRANPRLTTVEPILEKHSFDTEKAKKFFKQQIANEKDDIQRMTDQISGLQMMKDVSAEDLNASKNAIADIDKTIRATQSSNSNDAIIKDLEDQKHSLESNAEDLERKERNDVTAYNANVSSKLTIISKDLNALSANVTDARNKLINLDNDISSQKYESNMQESAKTSLEKSVAQLRKDYTRIGEQSDKVAEIKCPNCGCVLNQEAIDENARVTAKALYEIESEGKKINVQIQNCDMKIDAANKQVYKLQVERPDLDDALESAKKKMDEKQAQYDTESKSLQIYQKSEDLLKIEQDINRMDERIRAERLSTGNNIELNDKINQLEMSKKQHQDVIDAHAAYSAASKQIAEISAKITGEQKKQISDEQSMILIDSFIQTKLQLFKNRIKSVFGDRLEFVLIQKNIKAESWEECCYPTVLDKDTPFLNGSGSEQIMAGIYMAECIKKKLELEDLPYIFDECDKLDNYSMKKLDTKSQIITTRVDDTNYSDVTLVTA